MLQVLCNVESIWQTARDGEVPSGALSVGSTCDGERLYVGRVFHDGTLTPGKVHTLMCLENSVIICQI
jgi:hypothetical protein